MYCFVSVKWAFLSFVFFLGSCSFVGDANRGQNDSSVRKAPIALYLFNEGRGNNISDESRVEPKLDLKVTRNQQREISWSQEGAIHLSPGDYRIEKSAMNAQLASSLPAKKISQKIKASQAFSIELWFHPDNVEQTGPVRLVSISSSNSLRNVTIGHSASAYDFRVRTSDVNENGLPSLRTSSSFKAKAELTHIVFTYDPLVGARVIINGKTIPWFFYEGEPPGSQLSGHLNGWDEDYRLIIGDEFTGDRAWKGNIYQIAFFDYALADNEISHLLTKRP